MTDAADLRRTGVLADPRALCEALGLGADRKDRQLQPRGGITVRCPLHDGLSCSVTLGPDGTVRVRCFGCDLAGDAFVLVAAVEGLDVRRDFAKVKDRALELVGGEVRPAATKVRPAEEPAVSDETYDRIWDFALERCPLHAAPHVADYLDARGILADAEAAGVRAFPRDAHPLVDELLANFDRADLEAASLLRRGCDALNWSQWDLLIPWRARFGRISCLQRRVTGESTGPKYRSPWGRPAPAPFGIDLLVDALSFGAPEIVLVEGALDALARRRIARDRGEDVVVLGVYSASDAHERLPLDLLEGRRVVLALDDDAAGERACVAMAEVLRGVAAVLEREKPEGVKDWGAALERQAS